MLLLLLWSYLSERPVQNRWCLQSWQMSFWPLENMEMNWNKILKKLQVYVNVQSLVEGYPRLWMWLCISAAWLPQQSAIRAMSHRLKTEGQTHTHTHFNPLDKDMQKIASFCRPYFVCHSMLSLTDDRAEMREESWGDGWHVKGILGQTAGLHHIFPVQLSHWAISFS